jgi:hypothetical protein
MQGITLQQQVYAMRYGKQIIIILEETILIKSY